MEPHYKYAIDKWSLHVTYPNKILIKIKYKVLDLDSIRIKILFCESNTTVAHCMQKNTDI